MTFCDLQWVVEDDVEKSSWASTQVKFEKFVVTLKGEGEKALADLIRKVMTNQYDSCFRESASSGIGFAHEFLPGEGGDGDEEQSLRQCVLTFRRTLRDVPVPTSKLPDIGDDFVVPGDVDEECSVEIRKFVTAERKKLISFPWVDHGSDKTWKPGGSANAVLQKSHFIKSRGEPGRDHSLILLMPELWPARTSFTDPNAHKAPVRVSKELEEAAKWCTTAKNDNTVVVFGDGRDRKMRKIFENRVDETVGDDQKHLQVSLVYGMPPRGDIRFPKRKTFGSTVNLEILTVNLPVARVRISSKPRDHFQPVAKTARMRCRIRACRSVALHACLDWLWMARRASLERHCLLIQRMSSLQLDDWATPCSGAKSKKSRRTLPCSRTSALNPS